MHTNALPNGARFPMNHSSRRGNDSLSLSLARCLSVRPFLRRGLLTFDRASAYNICSVRLFPLAREVPIKVREREKRYTIHAGRLFNDPRCKQCDARLISIAGEKKYRPDDRHEVCRVVPHPDKDVDKRARMEPMRRKGHCVSERNRITRFP